MGLQTSGTMSESVFGGDDMSPMMPDSGPPTDRCNSSAATANAAQDRISELQDILDAAARAPIVRPSKLPTDGAMNDAAATALVSPDNEALSYTHETATVDPAGAIEPSQHQHSVSFLLAVVPRLSGR